MPKFKKSKQKLIEKKFINSILEGKTLKQSMLIANPTLKEKSAPATASRLINKPSVQEALNKAIEAIETKDINQIINSIKNDAKKSKKEVLTNDGSIKKLVDNTHTHQSREQILKLIGHPAFSRQTNIQINNNISPEVENKISENLIKLDIALKKLNLDIDETFGRVDVGDAELSGS